MPLPKPRKSESESDFIARCMSSTVMKTDFPKTTQRLAVCHSQFRKKESSAMETKEFDAPFELRAFDEDKGEFEGHAAIFNKADEFSDVILPGAFKKSLHKHPKKRVKMLRGHQVNQIIGVWEEIKEDSKGLFVKGRLLLQLKAAEETFVLMKEGLLDSMSIGFKTVIDQFDSEKKVRNLIEVKLFEISVVTFPAQLDALVTSVKHVSPEELSTKLELEKALRDAGFSRSTSQFITAGWVPPALRNAEGARVVESIRSLAASMKTASGG